MTHLSTKRLLIHEIKKEDASFLYQVMHTPGWFQFIGDRGISTITAAETYSVNTIMPSYTKNNFGSIKYV